MTASGALVLVGTPIGNMDDIAPRAIEALAGADAIACEDTRRTGKLLERTGIGSRPLLVVNDHTEERQIPQILERLARGERVALVSDAGMPGVSDPGEALVRAVVDAGCAVEVVPGPAAAITALVVSGLPTARFVFEGFLPRKGSARTERLEVLRDERRTVVLYEAPHRLDRTLRDLREIAGANRQVALCRELTKLHEETWRGSLDDAVAHCEAREPRGEYVVVLDGAPPPNAATDAQILEAIGRARAAGASTKDAVADVAAHLGVAKRRVYALATDSG